MSCTYTHTGLTVVLAAEAFVQGELGWVVGHGELVQQSLDHLLYRVGATDVQSVYSTAR